MSSVQPCISQWLGGFQKSDFVKVNRLYNIHLAWDLDHLKWETENWEQDQT